MGLSRRLFLASSAASAAGSLLPPFPGRASAWTAEEAGEGAPLAGINLAGADFGRVPGSHGTEYLYPTTENIDYYRERGFRLVRLPFKWERLQPEISAPFDAAERSRLEETVGEVLARGMSVALDPHNYAKRRLPGDDWAREYLIGSEALPSETFHDFWVRLAGLFANEPEIHFGLMNEPVGLSAEAWLAIVDGTVAAIREAGARNLILVPGVEYSGAHSWLRAGNTLMGEAQDPLDRLVFEVHQYFDHNSSGTSEETVSGTIGAERIEAFQEWARAHGHRGFLGEFGASGDRTSLNALADLCAEMDANDDVWMGWAAWAGGPRWPDDHIHTLEPHSDTGEERAQTSVLSAFARPRGTEAWIMPGADLDLDLARGRVFGADDIAGLLSVGRESEAYASSRSGALDLFAPDTPRITDLGLLIEEERRNLFQASLDLNDGAWRSVGTIEPAGKASPLGETEASALREEEGPGWCALIQGAHLAGHCAASIHVRHVSRRWLTIRGDLPSSAHAAFDVERGESGIEAGGEAARSGYFWGWQRLALAWETGGAGEGEVFFALQDRMGNADGYERTGARTALWGPMLEAGPFPTSFHPGRRAADIVHPRGPLADLAEGSEATLFLELRALPTAAVDCEILGTEAGSVLGRTGGGALRCTIGPGAETRALGARAWRGRIRLAVSMSRPGRSIAIAVTGADPVGFEADPPDLRSARLGSQGTGALNGCVTRIAAFARALAPDELAALVA